MPDAQQKIEKPASVKKGGTDNLVIRVMPKEFFGRDALDSKKVVASAPVPAPVAKPPPVPLKPISKTVTPPKKKSKLTLIIVIVGSVLIATLTIGGYFGLQYLENQQIVDEPVDVNPEPTPAPEPVPEPKPLLPTRSQDTDSDGLTDVEERLYGTDYRNPDSDGDSFLDGNEVYHRYDPLGLAPSTLLDTGAVAEFVSEEDVPLSFSITYPVHWIAQPGAGLISFVSELVEGSERFKIQLHEKEASEQSIEDWYAEEIAPQNGASDLKVVETKNGYSGLESGDQRRVYLDLGDFVAEFIYQLDDTLVIHYSQTFQMFVNSFSVQP